MLSENIDAYLNKTLMIGTSDVLIFALSIFLLQLILAGAIKLSFDKKLENYKNDLKIKEQSSKVAEYYALLYECSVSKEEKTTKDYIRINQLAWELAIILPESTYFAVRDGSMSLSNKKYYGKGKNIFHAMAEIRKILRNEPYQSKVNEDTILFHGPGVGNHNIQDNAPK